MRDILQTTFEKIYCINLDSRPDKWAVVQKEFEKWGILDIVERFPAIAVYNSAGLTTASGCAQSHLQIIRDAKKDKLDNVLILEDDVEFINFCIDYKNKKPRKIIQSDPREILALGLSEVKKIEWDFLYLGYNVKLPQFCNKKILSDHLFQSTLQLTTHAYAIRNTAYDHVLDDWDNLATKSGLKFSDRRVGIDAYYAFYLSHKIKFINLFPMVVGQREDIRSDIQHSHIPKPRTSSYKGFAWVKQNATENWMEYPVESK
tara:strand:+ start:5588 stop:6367 length:780 start_codon:yes stop_codon:yes gene_type:complete